MHVHAKLASDMTKAGFSKSDEQCRSKVKKITSGIQDNKGQQRPDEER